MPFTKRNIFTEKNTLGRDAEYFEEILQAKNVRIQRIISGGQTSDWYDQEEDEWVLLLKGYASIEFEVNNILELMEGDYIFIPLHCKHKVIKTSSNPPCIWLAIHFTNTESFSI